MVVGISTRIKAAFNPDGKRQDLTRMALVTWAVRQAPLGSPATLPSVRACGNGRDDPMGRTPSADLSWRRALRGADATKNRDPERRTEHSTRAHRDRDDAIVTASGTGVYSYRKFAEHFQLHLATVGSDYSNTDATMRELTPYSGSCEN